MREIVYLTTEGDTTWDEMFIELWATVYGIMHTWPKLLAMVDVHWELSRNHIQ